MFMKMYRGRWGFCEVGGSIRIFAGAGHGVGLLGYTKSSWAEVPVKIVFRMFLRWSREVN